VPTTWGMATAATASLVPVSKASAGVSRLPMPKPATAAIDPARSEIAENAIANGNPTTAGAGTRYAPLEVVREDEGAGAAIRVGIDIGGGGIKGAPVDTRDGQLAGPRFRLATPQPSTPPAVVDVVARIASDIGVAAPAGVTFPGVVRNGIIGSAANVDKTWIGVDLASLLRDRLGRPVVALNDADAAGMAEMAFGAGRGRTGVVVMVTFGTGIGTAIFLDGRLLPNSELGHLVIDGKDAEKLAAAVVRTRKRLSWKRWAADVNEYLGRLDGLLSPDLFIIGGGVSKDSRRFLPRLKVRAEIVPAQLLNEAGIVGAALAAAAIPSA
jgi:polyphosphate glucokinase